MNKELAQQLFDALKNGASLVSDTMSKELPLMAGQLINWMIAENAMWTMLGLITLIACYRYFSAFLRKECSSDVEDIGGAASAFLGFGSFLIFIINLFDLVKVIVAPKIVLLEYLGAVLGSGCK